MESNKVDVSVPTKTENGLKGTKKLTPKQEKFCVEYLKVGDMTQAYINSYSTAKMGRATISAKASDMSRYPHIAQRIDELRKEIARANAPVLDRVVKSIADIASFDIAELYDKEGKIKNIHDIPKNVRSAISSIKVYSDGAITEVKTLNKLDAFEKLMKHLGGYQLDNNQNSNKVMIIQLPDNGRQ